MPEVRGADCLAAWQEGVRELHRSGGEVFNLLTTIDNPVLNDGGWATAYSPNLIDPAGDRLRDVINTVFPYRLYEKSPSRADFYQSYGRVHTRGTRLPRNRARWGTYFSRLIAYGGTTNQLEVAVQKLTDWPRYTAALVFHLSCPLLDKPRTRGGPCWQYGEIVWRAGDVLDLVAVYRNHDFFNKALGNFIALGQLLQFIAVESGKAPGQLVCHSVHAYSQRPLKDLIALSRV